MELDAIVFASGELLGEQLGEAVVDTITNKRANKVRAEPVVLSGTFLNTHDKPKHRQQIVDADAGVGERCADALSKSITRVLDQKSAEKKQTSAWGLGTSSAEANDETDA